ncbi:MAG: succinylglutamate desuccinylase/aspartoacylase family protein [Burkholderiaceae bacterium]
MTPVVHPIGPSQLGTQRSLTSLHYGEPGLGEKAYLQASLHADELPGMLVMHHLIGLLDAAETAGRLRGEVVLVPVANPIGLAQGLLHGRIGRFDAASGENFNRGYPDYLSAITPDVVARLGDDAAANRATIRGAMRAHSDAIDPATELACLRRTLSSLALDADLVLDLHCDLEALLHLYCESPYWPQCEPLARLLGAENVLLAKNSGGASFDEHLSGVWWQLDERLAAERGAKRPHIPMACMAVTVELRGQLDVGHALAAQDARGLFDFLVHRGLIAAADTLPSLPALRHEATPLSASEDLIAPHAGVIAFFKGPGDAVAIGDVVAEIVDPVAGLVTPVRAIYAGRLYSRALRRYASPGDVIARIAGTIPFRTGNLLSP